MEDGSESLGSILEGSAFSSPATPDVKPAEPAAQAVPEVAPSATPKETPRDQSGRFVQSEKPAEPVKAVEPERKPEPMVPLSALIAERSKRKESEAQKPKTSIFDNEDAGIRERVTEEINPVRETLLELSLEVARSNHEDFDEVSEAFAKAAEADGRLWQQMRESRNPAKYIYTVGKQIRELADVDGDVVKYGEKKTAAVRAELAKEQETRKSLETQVAELQKQLQDLQALPRSLNTVPASGGPQSVAETDDDDVTKIVRFGNKR